MSTIANKTPANSRDKVDPLQLASRVITEFSGELEVGTTSVLALASALKMTLHSNITSVSLWQTTVSPSFAPTFAIFMLQIDGKLLGFHEEHTWDQASARACKNVQGRYVLSTPQMRPFAQMSDEVMEEATVLTERIQSMIDAWGLDRLTPHSPSRPKPRF